jgi:PleD family two-component response regulator
VLVLVDAHCEDVDGFALFAVVDQGFSNKEVVSVVLSQGAGDSTILVQGIGG